MPGGCAEQVSADPGLLGQFGGLDEAGVSGTAGKIFPDSCLHALSYLVRTTGATIVLSSTWRRKDAWIGEILDGFEAYGLEYDDARGPGGLGAIKTMMTTYPDITTERQWEIAYWLREATTWEEQLERASNCVNEHPLEPGMKVAPVGVEGGAEMQMPHLHSGYIRDRLRSETEHLAGGNEAMASAEASVFKEELGEEATSSGIVLGLRPPPGGGGLGETAEATAGAIASGSGAGDEKVEEVVFSGDPLDSEERQRLRSWVVLDDLDVVSGEKNVTLSERFRGKAVQTKPMTGLTMDDAMTAIEILRRQGCPCNQGEGAF